MAFLTCLWIFLQQTSPLRGKDQYRGGICHMTSSLKDLCMGSREQQSWPPPLPHPTSHPPRREGLGSEALTPPVAVQWVWEGGVISSGVWLCCLWPCHESTGLLIIASWGPCGKKEWDVAFSSFSSGLWLPVVLPLFQKLISSLSLRVVNEFLLC